MSERVPLSDAIAKLNRADTHLGDLRGAVRKFGKSNFYESVTEFDYKRRVVERARNVERPGQNIADLAKDCVDNYRAALDFLALELAEGHYGTLPDNWESKSAFPIFETGPLWRGEVEGRDRRGAKPKMRGMSRFAKGAIERVQPYHRRKKPGIQALWWLEELCNISKHRRDHLTAAVPIGASVHLEDTSMQGWEFHPGAIEHWVGPIKEGTPLTRITGKFPSPLSVNLKTDFEFDVAFDKAHKIKAVRGLPVMGVLGSIRAVIAAYVFPELDKELARLFPGLQITFTQTPDQDSAPPPAR